MNKTVIASFVAVALTSSVAFANGALHHKVTNNDALHARVAKAEAVLNQNSAVNTVSTHNWFNRISIGGLVNVDAAWSDRFPAGSFMSTNGSTDIYVNNANLIVDAMVNPWVRAHLNLAYLGDTGRDYMFSLDRSGTFSGDSRLAVDEAYVTLGNFARTPFFAIIGKQYVPFGHYDRYPLIMPLTQLLSQTRATAANFGVVTDMGFYGNVYAFNGGTTKVTSARYTIENFGVKAGFYGAMHNVGLADVHYDVNIGWINNLYDNDLFSAMTTNNTLFGSTMTYPSAVHGISLHGDLTFGRWDVSGNFVTAMRRLNLTVPAPIVVTSVGKLWAADVNAGFKFMTMGRDSRIGASYQFTGNGNMFNALMQAVAGRRIFGVTLSNYSIIPHRRYMLDYKVNVWNMTDLCLAAAHNVSYRNVVGVKRSSNEVLARLAVRF